jgi:hypothetical protein
VARALTSQKTKAKQRAQVQKDKERSARVLDQALEAARQEDIRKSLSDKEHQAETLLRKLTEERERKSTEKRLLQERRQQHVEAVQMEKEEEKRRAFDLKEQRNAYNLANKSDKSKTSAQQVSLTT